MSRSIRVCTILFIRALHQVRTVIIKICVDMSRRMWLVPVSSSLDNCDKTILKKLTLIQDLQYNCHKDNIM